MRRGRSLRLRLTAVFGLAMAVVLTALMWFLHVRLGAELLSEIDRSLGAHADMLLADPAMPDLASSARFVDPDEVFAQLLTPRGQVLRSSHGLGSRALLTPAQAAAVSSTGRDTYLTSARRPDAEHDRDRLLATPVALRSGAAVLVVGQTLSDRDAALTRQLQLAAVSLPVAVLVVTAGGWLLAGAALRPVESMRRRAADLSAHGGQARLPVPSTGDELARLATTLNDLLERLHTALAREHRFVDDASHELRTPLAVLKAELDLALARPRRPDELRDTLLVASARTDELVRLAEDMLVLARMRGGPLPLHRVPTGLPELLDRAVEPFRADAAAAGRELRVEAPDVQVCVDPIRTRQAVVNLVDNALHHGRGPVTVTATVTPTDPGATLTVDVGDDGEGFPAEVAATAFEPFTRGSGGSGRGAGLGLAIVSAVAVAHGGAAHAGCGAGGGTRVRLELPLPPTPGLP